ncbi:MAG: phosphotransferase [Gammaproteobacteria bacterium]|nr:phosphotransferase [Gammaproteobacteria bacterium]
MEDSTTDERLARLNSWLAGVFSSAPFTLEPASEDASFRRYFRVTTQDHSLIAMDAPPEKEDSRPFVRVSKLLSAAGLNVPQIAEADLEQGFLLLTDLGQDLYLQSLLRKTRVRELYHSAIDSLVTMQSQVVCDDLPPYDHRQLMNEMSLFRDWLLGHHLGISADDVALQDTMEFLATSALAQPRVFVHRDFHSRNLMIGNAGKPGILDFQDAMAGPVSYDLASLLKDCYVKWPESLVDELLDYYLAGAGEAGIETGNDARRFREYFELMGVQRHLKASGIFARLFHRDGKQGFLADVPRTLSYIVDCSDRHPELAYLGELVRARVLPALEAART